MLLTKKPIARKHLRSKPNKHNKTNKHNEPNKHNKTIKPIQKRRETNPTRTHYTKRTLHASASAFPWYKNEYNLQIPRIRDICARRISRLYQYSHPPRTEFPSYRTPFYTFDQTHRYYIIKTAWDDHLELNYLTDYFTEECRMTCRFGGNKESPLDYWKHHRGEIKEFLEKRGMKPNNYNVREFMYARNKAMYCNNFRINVCLEVLDMFKPKKWLDISAGWGDRLLSALLSPWVEVYTGVDPNPCLYPGYKKMINVFNPDGDKKCTLIKDGFETAHLPTGVKYDLVFSSPPFFDLEVYSGATTDSLTKYKNVNAWFNGFLMPSIKKAIKYLVPGGYLVLYIAESNGGDKYIPNMINATDKLVRNAGRFYYTDGQKIRVFYCWQK